MSEKIGIVADAPTLDSTPVPAGGTMYSAKLGP